jgi:hypothetical protein
MAGPLMDRMMERIRKQVSFSVLAFMRVEHVLFLAFIVSREGYECGRCSTS